MAVGSSRKGWVVGLSAVLVVTVLLAVVASGLAHDGPGAPAPNSGLRAATGATQQWAFGGAAGAAYSCSSTACGDGSNITSLSLHYYIGWVVIYTVTNISSTQIEFESQAALNASLSVTVVGCIQQVSGPCESINANANLAGRETGLGFTNITNTGTVNLTGGSGSPANVSAFAVMNAQSHDGFNFSGSFSETNSSGTATLNFDLGASEISSVNFASPLGIVPINVQPGDTWTASAPYTATGNFTSGYSLSASVPNRASESYQDWTNFVITPSGTLSVNGQDLGAYTLWDNYTSPATTVSGQLILLSFGTGEFTGSDGWLFVPSGLADGAEGFLGGSGIGLIAGQHPVATTLGGSESAYYQNGAGFIGAKEDVSSSSVGASGGPTANVVAGPEPVSVAEQQYSAITAKGSSGSAFPIGLLILAVVVVVVVVIGVLVVARRPGRRRPSGDVPPPYPTGAYSGWVPPATPPSAPDIQPPPPPPPPM
jgi:hypothetical protein